MGKLKSFFKHKFVIVSLCLILTGILPLVIMAFIPKATTYTNKDTVTYGHMGEDVTHHMYFEGKDKFYINYVNEKGEVVQERAISGTYEIKKGVFYAGGSKWGKISVYEIEVKYGKLIDASYECKPAKYARLASVAIIAIGGLMFGCAVYVGVTKKKSKTSASANGSYINPKVAQKQQVPQQAPQQTASQQNPHARKLPPNARKLKVRMPRPDDATGQVVQPQAAVYKPEPMVQSQAEVYNNEPAVQSQAEVYNNKPAVSPYENEYVSEPISALEEPEQNEYNASNEQIESPSDYINYEQPHAEEDAYDNLVRAIEQELEESELQDADDFIPTIDTLDSDNEFVDEYDPLNEDPLDKKDTEE